MMVNKDPRRMNAMLDFLSQMLEECERSPGKFAKIKEALGLEIQVEQEKVVFYLVKCEVLGGLCLLDYLYRNLSDRLMEKMLSICLAVSLMNHGGDKNRAQQEIIQNFKTGLSTSEGLRNLVISAIKQGKHDFIHDFLLEIPNTETKGIKILTELTSSTE